MKRTYKTDREFTNDIHKRIAIPEVYPVLGWTPIYKDDEFKILADAEYSIDYYASTGSCNEIAIQERFRKHTKYADITFRYERENSKFEVEQRSEFFKMRAKRHRFHKPFYMLYGILNQDEDAIVKYAVIDLRIFFDLYDEGAIRIDETADCSYCRPGQGVLYGCVKSNTDGSSTFVCFNIHLLYKMFKQVFVSQHGFIHEYSKSSEISDIQFDALTDLLNKNHFTGCSLQQLSAADYRILLHNLRNSNAVRLIHEYFRTNTCPPGNCGPIWDKDWAVITRYIKEGP